MKKIQFVKWGLTLMTCLYALLAIVHIWTNLFTDETFWKITLTFAVLFALGLVCRFVVFMDTDDDLHKKGFLDD